LPEVVPATEATKQNNSSKAVKPTLLTWAFLCDQIAEEIYADFFSFLLKKVLPSDKKTLVCSLIRK